jgi:hypothetical protein
MSVEKLSDSLQKAESSAAKDVNVAVPLYQKIIQSERMIFLWASRLFLFHF